MATAHSPEPFNGTVFLCASRMVNKSFRLLIKSPLAVIRVHVFAEFVSCCIKMPSLQTVVVRLFNDTFMDPDTFKLIKKLCEQFQLTPDIEFTCYEAYAEYFKRFFAYLEKRYKRTTLEYCGSIKLTNQVMDEILEEVEKTSLLHTLALISVCAKYINGFRSEKLFTSLSDYLHLNGTPFSVREIRESEYTVFKFIGFNVS